MIRTAIISVTASFVLFGAWTVNLVSYHGSQSARPAERQLRLKKLKVWFLAAPNEVRLRLTLLNPFRRTGRQINAQYY